MRNPELDGIDHINIYSQGRTELGKNLSNFAHYQIETEDGKFQSIEGYWYWLGRRDPRLYSAWGYNAKKIGEALPMKVSLDPEVFKHKIRKAINIKITSHQRLQEEFVRSVLPFDHYYVYDGVPRDAGYKWIVEHLENIRTILKRTQI